MTEGTNATNGAQEKKARNYGPKTPVNVKVSQILEWLEHGETRQDIADKLGLNIGQLNALFASSDKLKGKKTKKDLTKAFVLEDDVVEEPQQANGTQEGQPKEAGAAAGSVAQSATTSAVPEPQPQGWD